MTTASLIVLCLAALAWLDARTQAKKANRLMSALLEKFNGLNGHVGQLLDLAATQAGIIQQQSITLGNQADVIAALNTQNASFEIENKAQADRIAVLEAAAGDVPAVEQGVTDLDARVTAALPAAPVEVQQ